jgi:hypothetical protein
MPRIDRRIRARKPKQSDLWPAPPTAELCRSAVERATIEELTEARETLKRTPETSEGKIARAGLQFELAREVQRRFRQRLEAGLSQLEAELWIEILQDRRLVEWHLARKAARDASERNRMLLPQHRVLAWKQNAKN